MEHREDAPTPQGLPHQFSFAGALPQALRKRNRCVVKCLTTARATLLLEERKNQAHSGLHLFVGIQHDLAGEIIHQANWEAKAQFALLGFRQFSTQQALPQPMQLSLAHGALEAK